MTIVLRPDQLELVDKTRAAFRAGARSVVVVQPTGGGKTTTASVVIRDEVQAGRRVLFIAHLDSIIEDTHERLTRAGVWAGYVQAGRPSDPLAPVQVCSLATLTRRGDRPPADLLVFDECPRILATRARELHAAYPSSRWIGLTATPQRGDGQPFGDVFDAMVCGRQVRWLVETGVLAPCDVIAPIAFQEKALAMDPVAAYQRFVSGQRAIVFATNVAHAHHLTSRFREAGVAAECVVGDTDREVRRAVRTRMTAGELLVLVGVGVFVEGFDLPALEAVILARAFSVTGTYLQAIGRGMRTSLATGKTRCTVIDLRGSVHIHGLPDEDRAWSLDGVACRRTERLAALRRCAECLAIFRPTSRCPRCGASMATAPELPRVLRREEKLERIAALPQDERDRRYLARLEYVARMRLRLPRDEAKAWARKRFFARFGHEPTKSVA